MAGLQVKEIDAEQVAALVQGQDSANVAVVDVRGEDFGEGHVKGAVQWESERFSDDAQVDQLIQTTLAGKTQVVVHCAKSQVRGPRCAGRLAERLQALSAETGAPPEVLLMTGGFNRFNELYGSDAALVQKGSSSASAAE